ncbi:hypothetical protein KY284_020914 [Solanum tuberosum]|nr:hypothetical protein KY284_020914 [Solanum tuberosum]
MAQCSWSSCVGGRGRHWTKWSSLCLPENEGGDLYTITEDNFVWDDNYKRIVELATNGEWEVSILIDHILSYIKPLNGVDEQDKPYWMLDTKGTFLVKITWNYIRHKEQPNTIHTLIWNKGVPFKMVFMMWRLWKFKIPVDDKIRRWGMEGPSRCWCCERLKHVWITIKGSYYVVLGGRCQSRYANFL